MFEMMPEDKFLKLSNKEITKIIHKLGRPKNIVLVPDATRRTGIIYDKMIADQMDFEKNVIVKLDLPYLNLIKSIYDQGIHTILIPGLTHGNLDRGKQYVDSVVEFGLKSILTGKEWLDFYKQYDIKISFYGDFEYLKKITSNSNHSEVLKWCEKVKEDTKHHRTHRLFWGFGCSNSIETFRIIKLSIQFYDEFQRYPTDEEIIKLYYGEHLDTIDIFIRPGELRDSDSQPPLIGGNAQFYFPIAPLTELEDNFFRRILYDFIYCRLMTFDRKKYSKLQFDAEDVQLLKQYYDKNRNNIIGLGKKVSHFWLPDIEVKNINCINKKMNKGRE